MSVYYLAYGSNLHPLRLSERIPSSRLVGPVELTGYRLHFHKRGEDSSGKCNIVQTDAEQDIVYCALYHMDEQHKQTLDKIEGPGYKSQTLEVRCNNRSYECFVYVAEDTHIDDKVVPFAWYHALVHIGARYLDFPDDYIACLQNVETRQDTNFRRHSRYQRLIDNMLSGMPKPET